MLGTEIYILLGKGTAETRSMISSAEHLGFKCLAENPGHKRRQSAIRSAPSKPPQVPPTGFDQGRISREKVGSAAKSSFDLASSSAAYPPINFRHALWRDFGCRITRRLLPACLQRQRHTGTSESSEVHQRSTSLRNRPSDLAWALLPWIDCVVLNHANSSADQVLIRRLRVF